MTHLRPKRSPVWIHFLRNGLQSLGTTWPNLESHGTYSWLYGSSLFDFLNNKIRIGTTLQIWRNTLKPYNKSICIIYTEQNFLFVTLHFYVSFESKNWFIQTPWLYISTNVLPKLCMPFHFKMAGTSSTDDARVKVPSFQKVAFFLQYEIFRRDAIHLCFCLYKNVSDCRD